MIQFDCQFCWCEFDLAHNKISTIPFVVHLDVAAAVIGRFEIALDQKIRTAAIQLIRILFNREGGLVIIAPDRARSGYVAGVEFHNAAPSYRNSASDLR